LINPTLCVKYFSYYRELCVIFFIGIAAQRRPWPPHSGGFYDTHIGMPQSVGLLWTGDHLEQFILFTYLKLQVDIIC